MDGERVVGSYIGHMMVVWQIQLIQIVVMYSRYLDYSEPAGKAHHAAQAQCEQSDMIISNLKGEVAQLRQLDGDYLRLNDLIAGLESKYSLLLSERERADKQQKLKGESDRKNIIALRGQIDELRVFLQKANLKIEDLLRDNVGLKRQVDTRAAEINAIRIQIKEGEQKNQRSNDQNRNTALSIKSLKEERRRLEQGCEKMSNSLDEAIAKLKNIEKQVRVSESSNARLEKTLYQAEKDNNKLIAQLKAANDETKKIELKLKSTGQTASQLTITCKNLQGQVNKVRAEVEKAEGALSNEAHKGKQLLAKISGGQSAIRAQQDQLDVLVGEEQALRKQHFSSIEKNRNLNNEIDRILALIAQYQQVNRELLEEVQLVREQDQRARSMLTRDDVMKDIVETAVRRAATTEKPISHLKI